MYQTHDQCRDEARLRQMIDKSKTGVTKKQHDAAKSHQQDTTRVLTRRNQLCEQRIAAASHNVMNSMHDGDDEDDEILKPKSKAEQRIIDTASDTELMSDYNHDSDSDDKDDNSGIGIGVDSHVMDLASRLQQYDENDKEREAERLKENRRKMKKKLRLLRQSQAAEHQMEDNVTLGSDDEIEIDIDVSVSGDELDMDTGSSTLKANESLALSLLQR